MHIKIGSHAFNSDKHLWFWHSWSGLEGKEAGSSDWETSSAIMALLPSVIGQRYNMLYLVWFYMRLHVKWAGGAAVAYPGIFFGGRGQQIQLRTEGRENGDLGAVAPSRGFHSICKWAKPVFWVGCYRHIFHGTGNLAQLFQNFGISGGVENPPPPGYASVGQSTVSSDEATAGWFGILIW
jgi:hypothetical protein